MLVLLSFAGAAVAMGVVLITPVSPWSAGSGPRAEAGNVDLEDTGPPPDIEDMVLTPEDARSVVGRVPEFQADLLADGRLSFAEYRTAMLAYLGCIREEGGTVAGPPTLTSRGRLKPEVAFHGGDPEVSVSIERSCHAKWFALPDQLWSMHTSPREEVLQAARVALAACLRAAGFEDVPANPARGELVKYWPSQGGVPVEVFYPCQADVERQFDMVGMGFGG